MRDPGDLHGSCLAPGKRPGIGLPQPQNAAVILADCNASNAFSFQALASCVGGSANAESHLARGSGRSWKRTTLLVVPLPPSM